MITQVTCRVPRSTTSAVVNSNRILWAGLFTLLAGAAMWGAAQTFLSHRSLVPIDGGTCNGFADGRLRPLTYLSTLVGGSGTLAALFLFYLKGKEKDEPDYPEERISPTKTCLLLVTSAALLVYSGLLLGLGNGTIVESAGRHYFVVTNDAPFRALETAGPVIMIAGGAIMCLGFAGWLASRRAAQNRIATHSKGDPA
jgi:hypothetical protein